MHPLFDAAYEPLPSVQRYLARMGWSGPIAHTPECLSELIRTHQANVPYENLDVCEFHLPVSLKIADIYEKVVERRRGGYCFELNALFLSLLRALGFDAYACFSRVQRNAPALARIRHHGILVRLDSTLWFCDVGYGGKMFPGAIPLEEARHMTHGNEEYWAERLDEFWWAICRLEADGSTMRELLVGVEHCAPMDFELVNAYCYGNPDSVFVRHRRVFRCSDDGFYALQDNTLQVVTADGETRRELHGTKEIEQTLRDVFFLDITLP